MGGGRGLQARRVEVGGTMHQGRGSGACHIDVGDQRPWSSLASILIMSEANEINLSCILNLISYAHVRLFISDIYITTMNKVHTTIL